MSHIIHLGINFIYVIRRNFYLHDYVNILILTRSLKETVNLGLMNLKILIKTADFFYRDRFARNKLQEETYACTYANICAARTTDMHLYS